MLGLFHFYFICLGVGVLSVNNVVLPVKVCCILVSFKLLTLLKQAASGLMYCETSVGDKEQAFSLLLATQIDSLLIPNINCKVDTHFLLLVFSMFCVLLLRYH